jgi:hypothetical protein
MGYGMWIMLTERCDVEQSALNEASFVIARLLQRYDKPIRKKLMLTLSPADGVNIKLLHRAIS